MARFAPPDTNAGFRFDFDADGPSLGTVRLLEKTPTGYAPKTRAALEDELSLAYGRRFGCSILASRLAVVSRSLNQGDIAKAAIATQFLDLPTQAGCDGLAKASVDDPKHPGWPAGTPEGKGGEFRPQDGGPVVYEGKSRRVARLRQRRNFRAVLGRVLTAKRAARIVGEWLGDLVPFVDAVAGPASIADDVKLLEDLAADVKGSQAALDFAEQGPRDLGELVVSGEELSFSSYDAFFKLDLEKCFGSPGEGFNTITSSSRAPIPQRCRKNCFSQLLISSRYRRSCTRRSVPFTART